MLTGQPAGITIVKTATPNTRRGASATTVTYTFAVTNTGAVTLHGVDVTDPMTGLSAIDLHADRARRRSRRAPRWTAPPPTPSPRPTSTPAPSSNTATVAALDPADNPVTDTDGTTVAGRTRWSPIALTKTASPSGVGGRR